VFSCPPSTSAGWMSLAAGVDDASQLIGTVSDGIRALGEAEHAHADAIAIKEVAARAEG